MLFTVEKFSVQLSEIIRTRPFICAYTLSYGDDVVGSLRVYPRGAFLFTVDAIFLHVTSHSPIHRTAAADLATFVESHRDEISALIAPIEKRLQEARALKHMIWQKRSDLRKLEAEAAAKAQA